MFQIKVVELRLRNNNTMFDDNVGAFSNKLNKTGKLIDMNKQLLFLTYFESGFKEII